MSRFSCGCFAFWLEYTPWSGHFPWLDFPSFFCHLSGSSEVQKKAHFLETFDLAHWDQSFFKSVDLVLELFIWYLIICDLALLSDCVWVILPRENVSPLRSEWFTFLYTLCRICRLSLWPFHIPVDPPHSCSFSNSSINLCGCYGPGCFSPQVCIWSLGAGTVSAGFFLGHLWFVEWWMLQTLSFWILSPFFSFCSIPLSISRSTVIMPVTQCVLQQGCEGESGATADALADPSHPVGSWSGPSDQDRLSPLMFPGSE